MKITWYKTIIVIFFVSGNYALGSDEYCPLGEAILNDSHRRVHKLLAAGRADPNRFTSKVIVGMKRVEDGQTPLMLAADCAHLEVFFTLLFYKADIQAIDAYGKTVLMYALGAYQPPEYFWPDLWSSNKDRIVQYLAKQGNLDVADKEGRTALTRASSSGKEKYVRLLLSNRANPNSAPNTPLAAAVCCGEKETARLLLAHGADIDRVSNDGYTPLAGAAFRGEQEMAELLLAYGADVNCASKKGSPLQISIKRLIEIEQQSYGDNKKREEDKEKYAKMCVFLVKRGAVVPEHFDKLRYFIDRLRTEQVNRKKVLAFTLMNTLTRDPAQLVGQLLGEWVLICADSQQKPI